MTPIPFLASCRCIWPSEVILRTTTSKRTPKALADFLGIAKEYVTVFCNPFNKVVIMEPGSTAYFARSAHRRLRSITSIAGSSGNCLPVARWKRQTGIRKPGRRGLTVHNLRLDDLERPILTSRTVVSAPKALYQMCRTLANRNAASSSSSVPSKSESLRVLPVPLTERQICPACRRRREVEFHAAISWYGEHQPFFGSTMYHQSNNRGRDFQDESRRGDEYRKMSQGRMTP